MAEKAAPRLVLGSRFFGCSGPKPTGRAEVRALERAQRGGVPSFDHGSAPQRPRALQRPRATRPAVLCAPGADPWLREPDQVQGGLVLRGAERRGPGGGEVGRKGATWSGEGNVDQFDW